MDDQFNLGPFDRLIGLPGIEGPEDIFGNLPSSDFGENPFAMGSSEMGANAYNGNPFAGDNFWNIFAGGVNPSNLRFEGGSSSNPFGGGSSSNPFAGW